MNYTDDELNGVKDRNSVSEWAGGWVALRARSGRGRSGKYVGPCPVCSDDPQSKDATRFECDADKWVCAVCADGGDVIKLVRKREGLGFPEAVERLGGIRAEVITPAIAGKRGAKVFKDMIAAGVPIEATGSGAIRAPDFGDEKLTAAFFDGFNRAAKTHRASLVYRERERSRLFDFYRYALALPGSPAAAYLGARRLMLPPGVKLRSHPSMPYFADGRENEPRMIHRGPAMLAPIVGADGKFAGLHITWLDPAGPKGKADIIDPESGEHLPAKKCRGTKAGGYIDLGANPIDEAAIGPRRLRMFAGEGIETVLAVHTALKISGRLRQGDGFRSGIDLGNLCGRAIETVPHPTLKTEAGRARRIGGLEPDMTAPAMPVPAAVAELVTLGDGDSEPVLTRNALARAQARHAAPGRICRSIFAPDGRDFNDLL